MDVAIMYNFLFTPKIEFCTFDDNFIEINDFYPFNPGRGTQIAELIESEIYNKYFTLYYKILIVN